MSDFNDDYDPEMLADAMEASADDHPGLLRERSYSVHGLLQTARGMCTDECPHHEIDALLGRAVDAAKALEDQRTAIRKNFDTLDGQWHKLHEDYRALRAELEAVKNERDLAVLSLAALTPHNPNEGDAA